MERYRDLNTREGFVLAIKDCGQYIIDHAEGILGEYPGAQLCSLDITASFRFDSLPSVSVTRDHIAPPAFEN